MKKITLTIVLAFLIGASYSQSFNGVPISGSPKTVSDSFKEKGFKVFETSIENTIVMKGEVMGKGVELYIFNTPKSKKVYKVAIYFDKVDNWYSIKSDYNSLLNILTDKYGKPDSKYSSFYKPYYEGDGYEMQAVSLEKVSFSAFWFGRENTNISISISKFKMISVGYENAEMVEVNEKEKKELANKVF